MAHVNDQECGSVIAGLRSLADFLERNPDVPAPHWANVMVFPESGTEHEKREEINRIAALIGAQVDDQTATHGHYTAARQFGPVEYRAVFIPAASREYRKAKDSYADNIVPHAREKV